MIIVAHRPFALDKLKDYIDELVEIDDVYIPHQLRGFAAPGVPQNVVDKICQNQMEYIWHYKHDGYWQKGETKFEMNQRFIREFIEVHPELECLVPKSGYTVEEAQNSMKKIS